MVVAGVAQGVESAQTVVRAMVGRELQGGLQHRPGWVGPRSGRVVEVPKGERAGRAAGFPRFKTARAPRSVRFTTGVIRCEADRRHITLPRLGAVRSHESTRKLARRIEAGTARILSATVRQDSAGRWYCALQVIVAVKARPAHARRSIHPIVGVDVGVKADSLLVVATPGTEIDRVAAPKSLTAAQGRLRALQRRAARQHGPYDPATKTKQVPSKRWRRTQARIGRTHVHAAAVRRDVLHKATTALAQQHQVVVVETLNAAGMRAKGGLASAGSTAPWLMPPWPRSGACSDTRHVGTAAI